MIHVHYCHIYRALNTSCWLQDIPKNELTAPPLFRALTLVDVLFEVIKLSLSHVNW